MSAAEEAAKLAATADRLYSQAEVSHAAQELAAAIVADVANEHLLVLCVMNGGLVTTGLLLPFLPNLLQLDYVHATRYRNQIQGEVLTWLVEPHQKLENQHILLVDDIFDEGHTLKSIEAFCRAQGAASVRTAVLVNKQHDRKVAGFVPDYIGLEVPDRYVFGCGMDYKGYLRNLPGIFALPERVDAS